MRTAKTLIRSESSLDTQSFCWFCHEAAHFSSFIGAKLCFHPFLHLENSLVTLKILKKGTKWARKSIGIGQRNSALGPE